VINSISNNILETLRLASEAYIKYVCHYPIAEYTVETESASNPAFKEFVDVSCLIVSWLSTYMHLRRAHVIQLLEA
jgi:hypothetical protein